MPDSAILTNLERVRTWKGRIMRLGLSRESVAESVGRATVTVSRWMHPDKYGLPPAADIDRVDKWLTGLEAKKAKADARAALAKVKREHVAKMTKAARHE